MSGELNPAALLAEMPAAALSRWRMRSIGLAAIGIAGAAYEFMTHHPMFAQSYLIAFIFWMGITMGSLALLMVQYLSGGAWGLLARRIFEASTRNFWLMAILFIPIALNLPL